MKHRFRALPQFRHYIGESNSREERTAGATPNELRQMSIPQRMSIGRSNRYTTTPDGFITGIEKEPIVYSC